MPFVLHRMSSGVTLFFDTVFAQRYDLRYAAPSAGYGTLLEFYLGEDAAVDAKYGQLTDAGYHGRMTQQHTNAPNAAMVNDPDRKVLLLTSDNALGIGTSGASSVASTDESSR